MLPIVCNYTYLGVDFSYNRVCDAHIKKLIRNEKKKVNQLNNIISNHYTNWIECAYVVAFSSSSKPRVW